MRRSVELLGSAVRAVTTQTEDFVNNQHESAHVVIDVTVVPGVDTVTVTLEGKDPASGKYYTLLASTAILTVSTVVMRVGAGLVAVGNLVANDELPATWRVKVTHSGSGNFTYSVGCNLH